MADRDAILPQQGTPSRTIVDSVEWLFEPYWPGDRLIARLAEGDVTLTDTAGHRAGPEFDDSAKLLVMAIDADSAVVDGIWTSQAFMGHGDDLSGTEALHAFVAIDLLELDGAALFDIPFQERRRLLASVVAEGRRVRISPTVRVPLQPWLVAWRGDGFSRYVAKHQNSRYRPGEQAQDWLILSVEPERSPSLVARMFGRRRTKPRRIED